MVCALLIPEDPADAWLRISAPQHWEHDLQAPVHQIAINKSTQLLWSSRYWQGASKVNDAASRLAGSTVVGDAYLLSSTEDVEHLLHMAEQVRPIRAPRRVRHPAHPVQPYSRHSSPSPAHSASPVARRRSKDVPNAAPQPTITLTPPQPQGRLRTDVPLGSSPSKAYDTMHRILRSARAAPQRAAGIPAHPTPAATNAPPSTHTQPTQQQTVPVSLPEPEPLLAPVEPHGPDWRDLDGGLLMRIALLLPPQASAVLPIMQVCSAWRQALASHDLVLRHMWFNIDPHQPTKPAHCTTQAPCTAHNNNSGSSNNSDTQCTFIRRWLPPRTRASLDGTTGPSHNDPHNHHHHHAHMHMMHETAGVGLGADLVPASGASGGLWVDAQHSQRVASLLLRAPRVFRTAARHGNVSAMGCLAQLHEVAGQEEDAMRLWKKCAKSGDAEALLRLGMAHYVGAGGCPLDSETAHQYITKGLRYTLGVTQLSEISVDMRTATISLPAPTQATTTPATQATTTTAPVALSGSAYEPSVGTQNNARVVEGSVVRRVSMRLRDLWAMRAAAAASAACGPEDTQPSGSVDQCAAGGSGGVMCVSQRVPGVDYLGPHLQAVVASAAVVCGYIQYDGEGPEGPRADKAQAVTLFKLGVLAGSREAARILTWVFNTGQF